MTSENANTSRRDEFQKYLQRTGVTDILSSLLESLYTKDERPDDAFEYVRKYLADYRKDAKGTFDVEVLKKDLIDAKAKVKDLKKKINKLESKTNNNQSNNVDVPK